MLAIIAEKAVFAYFVKPPVNGQLLNAGTWEMGITKICLIPLKLDLTTPDKSMKSKLLLLFSMYILIACDNDEEGLNNGSIDSTIQISAKEISSPGEIILDCRTEKEYECFNNTIYTTKQTGQNSIEIKFESIKGEDMCVTAIGPATAKINLGTLAVGEYNLSLNTMDAQNKGLLKVTSTEITFEFNVLEGIDILTPIVQR